MPDWNREGRGKVRLQSRLHWPFPRKREIPHPIEDEGFKAGSPDPREMRKIFSLSYILGSPGSSKLGRLFIAEPIELGKRTRRPKKQPVPSTVPKQLHAIHEAMKWQRELERDPTLTASQIAEDQGVSRARISQLFGLLTLAPEIRAFLCGLEQPNEIRFFSERRLRPLKGKDGQAQRTIWNALKTTWSQRRHQ